MSNFISSKLDSLLESLKTNPSEKFESEEIEFKGYRDIAALHNKSQELAEELTALANKSGGFIIIGVKDSSDVKNQDWPSQLVGIEAVDELSTAKRLAGNLRPAVELKVTNHNFESKNYVVIEIPHRIDTLVSTAGAKYYIRSGRDSMPMEPGQVEDAVKALRKYDWSQDIIEVADVNECLDGDILESAIDDYTDLREFSTKIPVESFLESVGATINGKLTKGGLLFLGTDKAILQHIGRIEYRITKRELGGALPVNEIWTGSLWGAILKTEKLCKELLQYVEFTYDKKKYTFPTLNKIAFDEAFMNALVHRDYTKEGMVTIDFSDDRVVISNPGDFFGGINLENIFLHQPRHRNKALSTIFMNFKLMDKAGQGTKRMTIHSLKYGRKKPIFLEENNSVQVVLESNTINEGVFALTAPYENYDIAELLIINELERNKEISVESIVEELKSISITPWNDVKRAVKGISYIEFSGNESKIKIQFKASQKVWDKILNLFLAPQDSQTYVSLYCHLMDHKVATIEELRKVANLKDSEAMAKKLETVKFMKIVSRESPVTYSLV